MSLNVKLRICDQKNFIISEVAAAWHELIVHYAAIHCPTPANNWTRGAAGRHTTAQISHTWSLPVVSYLVFSVPLKVGG